MAIALRTTKAVKAKVLRRMDAVCVRASTALQEDRMKDRAHVRPCVSNV